MDNTTLVQKIQSEIDMALQRQVKINEDISRLGAVNTIVGEYRVKFMDLRDAVLEDIKTLE